MPGKAERLLPFRTAPAGRAKASAPGELGTLLNLGPKSSVWLAAAGIHTRAELERLGPIEACRRIRRAGHPVSVLLAYAIEGGLMGCHWTAIPPGFKQQLKVDFARMRRAEK